MTARIVVTGLGVVAPNGLGTDDHWKATLATRSGVRTIARFDASGYPVRVAGEVGEFTPAEHVPGRLVPQTDRTTQFALAAAQWAVEDAGVDLAALGPYDAGVITASGCGGFEFGQRELQKLWSEGPQRVSAYQSFAWFYAVNTGQLSIRHGARGAGSVVVSEQAGGLDALASARRRLRGGDLTVVLGGGLDAPLSPWGLTAQIPVGLLSTRQDPDRAFLPFDADASGYVPGEGGAVLVVEELEAARRRGAPVVYGELAGYAATFDPRPGSGRPPALARAIVGALDDAGLRPADVDVVFADASGVPAQDAAEAAALREVFGPRGVPVAVPKTMTGRLYAGGAPLDVAGALLSIRDSVVPAAANVRDVPEAYDLDVVVDGPRELPVRAALVVARGHGGFNSALVVRAV
ncbi:ketosynthase chain-length factor [Streptomyces sp. IBSBF 2953]|uniref:Lct32 n=1 Tax=Streptomyces rishiriensis TaxID=68264 RepID=B0LJ15_STRRH|nr:ketosynthase chain-length factor [Streptomyces scabiei]ABX71115.1 Lct32 [Streptomyces rishiriensis]MCQ9184099.1 ketosynthase chain-length factor [Streptomyces hayashii]MDX3117009.1 ketosynthase chain-length factor [Streptomyces scabiei]